MTEFFKTSDIHVTGAQKAAILLGELGDAANDVYRLLNLPTNQIKKIRQAYKTLGRYNPDSDYQAHRENVVLEEVIDYGEKKGIYFFKTPEKKSFVKDGTEEVAQMVSQNPDAVAQLLKSWLES